MVQLATRMFDVSTAVISLVDLGKQYFLARHDKARPMTALPICTHLVQSPTLNTLQLKNVAEYPEYSGRTDVGFYAAAALISPEGYKLGTFCLMDSNTREHLLTDSQMEHLADLAAIAIQAVVDQRRLQQHIHKEDPAKLIAYAAHDLMTPLSGVQLSLSLLADDEQVCSLLNDHQMELLTTATSCSDLTIRICETAIDSLRQQTLSHDKIDLASPLADSQTKGAASLTNIVDLVKSLKLIMEPIPKSVPLVISLDPAVPATVRCDDLRLFRAALNLLSSATERTERGSVHLRIFLKKCTDDFEKTLLVFECEDSAPDVPVELYPYLFQATNSPADKDEHHALLLALSSVASLIKSMDGEYNFRPRSMSLAEDDGKPNNGSVFSFSLQLNEDFSDIDLEQNVHSVRLKNAGLRKSGSNSSRSFFASRKRTKRTPSNHDFFVPLMLRSGSNSSIYSSHNSLYSAQDPEPSFYARRGMVPAVGVATPRAASWHSFGTQMQYQRPAESYANAVFDMEYAQAKPRADGLPSLFVQNVNMVPLRQSAIDPIPTPADAIPEQIESVPRQKRSLVIEDSLVVRKGLVRALSKLGYDEVRQAVNGLEGLEAMKETMFDMVLCDFLMPVMDGLDCVKQYREWEKENRPTHRQPIIGISAHVSVKDSDQGIDAGMDDFRSKPISIKTLIELQDCEAVIASTRLLDGLSTEPEEQRRKETKKESIPSHPASLARPSPTNDVKCSAKRVFEKSKSTARTSKRSKTEVEQKANPSLPVCLIAMESESPVTADAVKVLESTGWKVVSIDSGQDAIRLLKMRNWDAVLIDEDLSDVTASKCIADFRNWEGRNRVNEQRNVFLLCDFDMPDPLDLSSVVQPPTGFNGVLRKQSACRDLNLLVKKKSSSMKIVLGGLRKSSR
ncbi:two-component system, OmpR family, response regulator QseB [Fistulifera solaris]|uniref:Two-component system, OmpR family, response regulator QseB n=1 Tax=Fistulifera solaris TaxID=1519565 RepID=A0A1Z5JDD6_FISSO|nr:two-component system, OmpR family, response regulator QseB [Fistulifera solaris]|eukprot:GAX12030.1 two-component system, OmpR family, response regulator QseB [Fistulifera solaris]